MKITITGSLMILFCLLSCGRQQQIKAKIFQRKEITRNRLRIVFKYRVNNEDYVDSATIHNIVINNDSIGVIIDPDNPAKAIPDIKN